MECISPELFVGHPFDGKKALIAFLEVAKRPKDLKTSTGTDWYKVFCHREICWKCSSPIPVYMQQFGLISLKRTSLSDLQKKRLRLSHALLRRNLVVSNRICPSFSCRRPCMPFYMGVSENSGFYPQIIHFNRVFHYKPSIFGVPLFLEIPRCFKVVCVCWYLIKLSTSCFRGFWFPPPPLLKSLFLLFFFGC